jgi:hypothetical protein
MEHWVSEAEVLRLAYWFSYHLTAPQEQQPPAHHLHLDCRASATLPTAHFVCVVVAVTLFGIFLGLLLSTHELSWWYSGKGTAKVGGSSSAAVVSTVTALL